MDWPQTYCAALEKRAGRPLGLSDDEIEGVLDLARDVAHATERRFAPVSAYVAGKFVMNRVRDGASATDAVHEAQEVVGRLLGA